MKSFDNTKLYYIYNKRGKYVNTLIFLHGWGHNHTVWKKEIEFFNKKGYNFMRSKVKINRWIFSVLLLVFTVLLHAGNDWENEKIIGRNKEAAHAYFRAYDNLAQAKNAERANSPYSKLLNGSLPSSHFIIDIGEIFLRLILCSARYRNLPILG